MKTLLTFLFLTVPFHSLIAQGQQHNVKMLRAFNSKSNLDSLSEALMLPLLIRQGAVYAIAPECWPRNADGDANDRNNGGDANDRAAAGDNNNRNAGGSANDRSNAGANNDRNAGGSSNDRNTDGSANERNGAGAANERDNAGDANDRNNAGDANERNAGGSAMRIFCNADTKGHTIIFFENCKPEKGTRIFYHHHFHKISSKNFKLQIL